MPLYLTSNISDFEIAHNSSAVFTYFDTVKEDSTHPESLAVKSLDLSKRIPIFYRKNMSSDGSWSKEEFSSEGLRLLSLGFDSVRSCLKNNLLVILPMRSFSLAKSSSDSWVADSMDKKYIEVVNTNTSNKDGFEYHAV